MVNIMILSVSRKTDIPAYYSDWFINRLKEGFVLVQNSKNLYHVNKVNLSPKTCDMIVFWTKNPEPIIDKLDIIDELGYKYYFQFSLTPYDKKIEKNLPSKLKLIDTFIKLSEKIGKDKVIWRYDPIIISGELDINYHKSMFDLFCDKLHKYTSRCVISFQRDDKSIEKRLGFNFIKYMSEENIKKIAKEFSNIAFKYGLELVVCQSKLDLSMYNIKHASCIDKTLIENLLGEKIEVEKDPLRRKECNCVKSIDIGAINTCLSDCKHCQSNLDSNIVRFNNNRHSVKSPLIIGGYNPNCQIQVTKTKTLVRKQISLFDL